MTRVGEKLGRYELTEQLGKGAAGTVFRARDSLLGIDVCVKVLHSGLATQPGITERFKRELLLARRIAHPGICKIFDIQEVNGTHFLTMEYVKGETLSTILNRDGQMDAKDAVRVMRKVAEALGAAHKAGVVHRDIKPGNIIIGDNERVTIVDFGVATAEDLDRLTRAGVVLGSRSYMAPETWQGKAATAAGDVWALGIILYGCVTGRLPYKGEGVVGVFDAIKNTKPTPPSAFNGEVTPELEQVIFKAMCVDPAERYQDAAAVEAALAGLELTLDDDGASTVVRAPSFAPAAKQALPTPPVSPPKAPVARSTGLPTPPPATDRLHRPAVVNPFGPPPGTPPSQSAPPTKPLSKQVPHKSTEEISVIGEEMSLYAPADASGSLPSSEMADVTRVGASAPTPDPDATRVGAPQPLPDPDATRVGPPPAAAQRVSEAISAENVEAAFDAAFAFPSPSASSGPPHTDPDAQLDGSQADTTVGKALGDDDNDMQGMNLLLGQTVVSGEDALKAQPPGARGLKSTTTKPSSAPQEGGDWKVHEPSDVLGFDALSDPQDDATKVQGAPLEEGDALGSLATAQIAALDRTAVSENAASSFFNGAPDASLYEGMAAGDATRIEPFPMAPEETLAAPSGEETHHIPREPKLVSDDLEALPKKGPNKAVLAAAAAGVLLLVGIAIFALGGGEGGDASGQEPETLAAATKEEPAAKDPAASDEWVFNEQEGQPADPAAAQDPKEDPAAEQPASDEAAEGAVAGAEEAPEGADDEGADEGAVDEAADEEAPEPAIAAASEPASAPSAEEPAPAKAEPAVERTQKRRSSQSIAKSRYKKKRSALSSVLARKGIVPGDSPGVDNQRRAMNAAARKGDYDRAAAAADNAIDEAAKVKIDAGFIGKKLARFNQGYDKTKDESLRQKLKGVLKEVGADYSKGRYDDANKKLNRAFTLMGR